MSLTKSPAIRLTVNGDSESLAVSSIRGLLDALSYDSDFIAVAINQTVIPRTRWGEGILRDGDDVEIVSPRQGG